MNNPIESNLSLCFKSRLCTLQLQKHQTLQHNTVLIKLAEAEVDTEGNLTPQQGLGVPVVLLNSEHVPLRNTQGLSHNSKLVFSCCCCCCYCCSHVRINLFISLLFQKKQEQIFVKLKHHALALCASAPSAHTGQRHSTTTLPILRLNFSIGTSAQDQHVLKICRSFSIAAANAYSHTCITSSSCINQCNVSC